jgi:diguanylate cyclase (GGDEF)-like protein/PAS domain S-box-containing protein
MPLRVTLLSKVLGFVLLASIIPLLVTGLSSYQIARRVLRDQATSYTAELVSEQTDYFDLQLQQVDSLIANISGVDAIVESLDQPATNTDTYTSLATQARIGYILSGYSNLKGLVSIDIFTTDDQHYHVGDTLNVSNIRTAIKDRIFSQALRSEHQIIWTGIEDNVNANSSAKQVLTAAKILHTTDDQTGISRPVALLLVNYSVNSIYDHLSQLNLGAGSYMMAIDAQNRIIYHPNSTFLGDQVPAEFVQRLSGDGGTFTSTIEGQEMLVTYDRSALSNWVVVSFIPTTTIMAPIQTIGLTTLAVLLAAFAVVVFSAWMMWRNMITPIRNITHRFKDIQAGILANLSPLHVRSRDEIGDLTTWFNTFLASLKDKQRAEAALRESEERYSLALRGANDGIWDWDLRVNTIHYSTRWKAMLGFQEHEIGDHPDEWFSRIHPEDRAHVQAAIDGHLAGSLPYFESEHRVIYRDGTTVGWVLARGLAVRDPGGSAYRMAGSLTDYTHRKAIEARLWHDGTHDRLTGLPNRGYFMDQLQRVVVRGGRRGDEQAAVLFFDLDRFKIVNDSLGHASGDQLLIVSAQRLAACVRSRDTIARFGGDEFAVLLDQIGDVADAIEIADRIQQNLSAPLLLQGHAVSVSASIGIAMLNPQYQRAEDLLRDADTALYQAKANGKAQYAIFDAAMHAKTLALLRLEAELKRGLEQDEFRVYYQPIVSLNSRRVTGVEALLRWAHPERGLIGPDAFITLAEETGLIVPLGEWVLRRACAQAQAWRDAGITDVVMSVNLSARQIHSAQLPDMITAVLAATDLPPASLQLEITESAAMIDLDRSIHNLRKLQHLGVQVAMDDFGISYSSLGYLKRLPIDRIKIAQAFIRGVPDDANDAAIGGAIISMAHILGLEVIAEGVETYQQLAFLRAHTCDAIQGYLISEPLDIDSLNALLQSDTLPIPGDGQLQMA